MDLLLSFIIPLLICFILRKNYILTILCYGLMLFLYKQNMTVMVFANTIFPISLSIISFAALVYIEVKYKTINSTVYPQKETIRILSRLSAIIRFPINCVFLNDFIFRLQNWGPIDRNHDGPNLGAAIGAMLTQLIWIILIMSLLVLSLYIFHISKFQKLT